MGLTGTDEDSIILAATKIMGWHELVDRYGDVEEYEVHRWVDGDEIHQAYVVDCTDAPPFNPLIYATDLAQIKRRMEADGWFWACCYEPMQPVHRRYRGDFIKAMSRREVYADTENRAVLIAALRAVGEEV